MNTEKERTIDQTKRLSLKHLTKWLQVRFRNIFIPFTKWQGFNIVQDYITYPIIVNDRLASFENDWSKYEENRNDLEKPK